MLPGHTGEFFTEQTVASLAESLARFDARAYDPATCRSNAERFSRERFEGELREFVVREA